MAKLKLAYGHKDDIQSSINSGKIPRGSLIYTDDSSEIYFYDLDGNLRTYKEKNKFSSKEDAINWVNKYSCHGEIFSVLEGDVCNVYVVGYDNELRPVNEVEFVQPDWNTTDTEDPSFIKNKPEIINDKIYTHVQKTPSSTWIINHKLNKMPSVTVVDSANTVVAGDIKYVDMNNIIVNFSGAFSGKAFIN